MLKLRRFLNDHFALVVSLTVFVAFTVVGFSVMAQDQGKHHGDNCEWNEFGEVVCEDTPTPTSTPDAAATSHAITQQTVVAARQTAEARQTAAVEARQTAEAEQTAAAARKTVEAEAEQTAASKTATAEATATAAARLTATAEATATAAAKLTATAIAEPTITPTPTPTPTGANPVPPGGSPRPTPELPSSGSPSQKAYRWLYITWTAPGDYVRFEIEASVGSGNWVKVPEVSSHAGSNKRAIIDHRQRTAHVRGLKHSVGQLTFFRITGFTRANFRRTSAKFSLLQDPAPISSGHQHDHTVAYSVSPHGVETLDGWLRYETGNEAAKWNALPLVHMCETTACTTNMSGVVTLEAQAAQCSIPAVACVPIFPTIEPHIGDETIRFERNPISERTGPDLLWRWTRVEARHKAFTDATQTRRYLYLNAVILHELGHVLGLNHATYASIMNSNIATVEMTDADKKLLEKIYESHTPNTQDSGTQDSGW